MTEADLVAAASRALGREVREASLIGGGGNSRIYRIETCDGESLALKWYFADDRNRLGVEFRALQFLHAHGIHRVPRAVSADPPASMAVYEFVEGAPALRQQVTEEDIADALEFAQELRDVSRVPGSGALPAASEACFSLVDLRDNLERRTRRLEATAFDTDTGSALHGFLERRFRPTLVELLDRSEAALQREGVPSDIPLPATSRTLSPSDFGFHNAIRRGDTLIFIDFEYFGWDDPAKLAADFLLHPAMSLSDALKRQFLQGVLECFAEDRHLPVRIAAFYPLFALKWCLIVLNEFLPAELRRRRFAAEPAGSPRDVQMRQLGKAETILAAAMAPSLN